ncbi:glycoside hydrolase family 3 domain-containing protein [Candidatus Magnetoovum chiemensis]|nr:glycoside hydrolase family 3 domain-containing protein [Candidatus Magnetoovum chiemensis]
MNELNQLIIPRLDGDKLNTNQYRDEMLSLVENGIGGFIIFGGELETVRSFISQMQSTARLPLLIASDIERGVGQQLRGAKHFSSQMAVCAAINRDKEDDVILLDRALNIVAACAKSVGINMPLIPVLDINSNPLNPIICTRAFSDNHSDVSWFGAKYIEIFQSYGHICCAKHFPGHGDTDIDSHITLPVINKTKEKLFCNELLPFIHAVKVNVAAIMVGHLCIPSIDNVPATISRNAVLGILRQEMSYQGLIITDALTMDALRDIEALYTRAINAGADILLHPSSVKDTVKELTLNIENGIIKEATIEKSLQRISNAKASLNNKKDERQCHFDENLLDQISQRSITLLKGSAEQARDFLIQKDTLLVLAGESEFIDDDSPIKKLFRLVERINETSAPSQSAKHRRVLICAYNSISAWKGSSGLSSTVVGKVNDVIRQSRASAIVSFGSPYILRDFLESADILIAAYEPSISAQMSLARCLKNEQPFTGRAPVKIF